MTSSQPPPLPDRDSAVRVYLRAVGWLVPTVFFWLFSNAFMLPKLKQIWELAGLEGSKAQFLMDASSSLKTYLPFFFAAPVAIVIILETRWSRWPRYRRAVIAGFAIFVNTVVLAGITAVATSVLLAAPLLTKARTNPPPPAAK